MTPKPTALSHDNVNAYQECVIRETAEHFSTGYPEVIKFYETKLLGKPDTRENALKRRDASLLLRSIAIGIDKVNIVTTEKCTPHLPNSIEKAKQFIANFHTTNKTTPETPDCDPSRIPSNMSYVRRLAVSIFKGENITPDKNQMLSLAHFCSLRIMP